MHELEIDFDRDISLGSIIELNEHCNEQAALITSRDTNRIPQFQAADGQIIWPLLTSIQRHTNLPAGTSFCEWGSGLGLVTMLAASLDMNAHGFEIESELVSTATQIAQQFGISVKFECADIFALPEAAYQADIIFAYPWPAQKSSIIELFEQTAKPDAILFCYQGGLNYQVLRKQG